MSARLKLLRRRLSRAFGVLVGRPEHPDARFVLASAGVERQVFVRDNHDGSRFLFHVPTTADRHTVVEVFRERAYSFEGLKRRDAIYRCFESLRSRGTPLIIDAGANIGASSLLFTRLFPGARVLAVEPEARNLRLLRQHADSPEVRVIEAALGPAEGQAFLDVRSNPRSHTVSEQGQQPVTLRSIPGLLADHPDALPFLLKLDIEGAEAEVFADDCAWIDRFPVIVIEPHDWRSPRSRSFQGFLRNVASRDRDFLILGENIVSISNDLVD